MENILNILPVNIKENIEKLENLECITEIRLRVNKKIFVYYGTRECIFEMITTKEELISILRNVSQNSIYAVQENINNGYVTVNGGHRIGITGEVVWVDGKIKNIKNISSMNIRIAKEYIGVSNKIINSIATSEGIKNTIIISPPLCGKTTILRDVIRNISDAGNNVCVIDERGEITSMYNCSTSLNIGDRTDVISNVPKELGMQIAIRTMAPQVVCTDEIGTKQDAEAMKYLSRSGVKFIATMHGKGLEDIASSNMKDLLKEGYIETVIVLSKTNGIGTIEKICTDINEKNNIIFDYNI